MYGTFNRVYRVSQSRLILAKIWRILMPYAKYQPENLKKYQMVVIKTLKSYHLVRILQTESEFWSHSCLKINAKPKVSAMLISYIRVKRKPVVQFFELEPSEISKISTEDKGRAWPLYWSCSSFVNATLWPPATKVIIHKSRYEQFLWNSFWDLGCFWADWQYWKKNGADYEQLLWAVFFIFS